jgi:hypothetical protein
MKLSTLNLVSVASRRIVAKNRRLAAIHEAGHVGMARRIGLQCVSARLEKTSHPSQFDKLWIGQTRFLPPSLVGKIVSERDWAMFGVSGRVAEYCWRRISFDETEADDWYDDEVMSASDWAACRCDPGNPTDELLETIKIVFSLFDRETGKLWRDLLVDARSLIKMSRNSGEYRS